jgi:alkylation response protein AidB-like acyl-CoA dehydrogenase
MPELEQFRADSRAWLEANCPASMRTPMVADETVWGGRNASYKNPDSKLWLDRMGAKGWTAPMWPAQYGGGGLTMAENAVLESELRRIKARPALSSFGLWMLGPVLLEFANEEQKLEHLPKIVRGDIRWCQGYSEPGAGSDLAGLQTKAVRDGDEYVINGQKVWTSYANYCDWIFCLVRTDTSVKHNGISFMLFDMKSPGVTVKPIQLISGESPFCETFFDDVRVPARNQVGELNKGWTIAKRLLQHERTNIGDFGTAQSPQTPMHEQAKKYLGEDAQGRLDDAAMRREIAKYQVRQKAYGLTYARVGQELKAGLGDGAASSILKAVGAELNKHRSEMLIDMMGTQGIGWEGEGFNDWEIMQTRGWLRSKANSIEGGTTEINKNVVAKNVLGLPTK